MSREPETLHFLGPMAASLGVGGLLDPLAYLRDLEARSFPGFVLATVMLVALLLTLEGPYPSLLDSLRNASFTLVSVVTSTGFGIVDFAHWTDLLTLLMICISFVGGCEGLQGDPGGVISRESGRTGRDQIPRANSDMTALTLDERLALTRRTMDLLEGWGLGARDITAILQLPDSVKSRHVVRFREEEPFPDEPVVNRRVAYLLRIEEALHTYFPRNPEMRNLWVKRGNKQFGRRAPIAVMVEDGESGLISVLSHLDCTFAWDLTGSKTDYGTR